MKWHSIHCHVVVRNGSVFKSLFQGAQRTPETSLGVIANVIIAHLMLEYEGWQLDARPNTKYRRKGVIMNQAEACVDVWNKLRVASNGDSGF